jgi:acetyl-CoA synthetase
MAREQTMISIMGETRQFDPPEGLRQQASIKSLKQYKEMVQNSLEDTETFWGTYAQELDWFEKWAKVFEGDFERAQTKWFVGGRLNAAYNCLDRHPG